MDRSEPALALEAHGLSYRWNPTQAVLSEFSFELQRGEMCALLGPNGSGKSTLTKLVSGILPRPSGPHYGLVRYLGQNFWTLPPGERAKKIVYVGSHLSSEFPMTAEEVVSLGRTSWNLGMRRLMTEEDAQQIQWAMEAALCWDLRARAIETLSGGERQLVSLARALAQEARVLLLDESLSRMDLNHQAAIGLMLKRVAKEGRTILLVSHDVNLAMSLVDTAILMRHGKKIAQGPLEEVIHQGTLEQLYPGAQLEAGVNPLSGGFEIFLSRRRP